MPKLEPDVLKLTNEVTVAFLSRNAAKPDEVAGLMRSVHDTLLELTRREFEPPRPKPVLAPIQKAAVPIADSVSPDFVSCLECGRKLRTLRFHLKSHGLSPAAYIAKWALPADYPTAAPSYKALRSDLARKSDFGHYRKLRRKIA